MPDCLLGVIFDGLESIFTQNMSSSAQILLKAINNRKYIFTLTLKLDWNNVREATKEAQLIKGIL